MTIARPSTSALLISTMLAMLAALGFADRASAAVKCQHDATTRQLSVSVTGRSEALVRRAGESIRLSPLFGPDFTCEGAPTVTNTDLIALSAKGFSAVGIDLDGGPLAPGATAEAGDSSEIEFTVSGTGIAVLDGGRGADHLRFMAAEGVAGLNLNPGPGDDDVEVALPDPRKSGVIFVASGGPGRDTIDVVGRPPIIPFADGGPGNDTLIGRGSFGGIFDGGDGRDRITGSPNFDALLPGRGADKVNALGGDDEIEMKPDGSRDQVDCGAGRDSAGPRDPVDRLRSCERLAREG